VIDVVFISKPEGTFPGAVDVDGATVAGATVVLETDGDPSWPAQLVVTRTSNRGTRVRKRTPPAWQSTHVVRGGA
jgi:hypothetical protein